MTPQALPTASAALAASSAAKPGRPAPSTTANKTFEREAADTVARGDFLEAARLYDELAKAHPEVPAFPAAARILRERGGRR
jgi:hypothetical protein